MKSARQRQQNSEDAQRHLSMDVADLKAQFRAEDKELAKQGLEEEVHVRNRRLMGIKDGQRGQLVGWGGKIFR